MNPRKLLTIASIAALFGLAACTHHTGPYHAASPVDGAWGDAHRSAQRNQLDNPDAPVTTVGPQGMDASTGERVADRYYKGQESQQTRRAQAVVISNN